MIPGANLLSIAMGAIGSQPVSYFKNTSRAANEAGFYVGGFAPGVAVRDCSVQPMPRSRYENLGLDLSRDYVQWFVSRAVIGVERDAQGDVFNWAGKRWQVESITDWSVQDGWVCALAVRVEGAPNA